MRRTARASLVLAGVTLLGVACAEYVLAPGERVVRGLQLDSLRYTVDEGQRVSIIATAIDELGVPFSQLPAGIAIAWSSSDTAVARVDTAGVLSGVLAGAAKVAAAVHGDFGAFTVSAEVTVRPLVSAIAAVAGDGQSGAVGQPLGTRLQVRVTNRLGAGVPRIPVDFTVTAGGGSLDTASSTTDSAGLATAGLTLGTVAGADTVQVRSPRLPGAVVTFVAQALPGPVSALIKVSGDSQVGAARAVLAAPLVVKLVDRYANPVPGITVAWAVATGGGSIAPASAPTNAQGTASAQWTMGGAPGAQTATASVGGVLTATFGATATLPVASVTVTPSAPSLASGATLQLTATPKDSAGNVLTGRIATWTTSDSTVAKVSATGLVTGVKVGAATVTATVEGVGGTATVTVTAGPASVATSQVSVSAPTVLVGGTATFTLTTRDAAGNALGTGGLTVGFATAGGTSAGTIGAVTDRANGTYTAVFTGTTPGTPLTVGATIGGQAVTTTLPTVQVLLDTVVASVSVTPSVDTVASGVTAQLTATPRNAGGTALTGKPVTWATSDSTVAKVSATGLVTAVKVGTATITATVQGVAGTAAVTAKPGAPSTTTSFVTVTPSSVAVGGTVALKLTTIDAAGNTLTTGGHTVTFTQSGGTSAGTVGAVTDAGDGTYVATFTAATAGTPVAIGATIDGQTLTPGAPPPTITVTAAITFLVHWINPAGGSWGTATNWSPARVPTLQDTAVIDAAGAYVVTANRDSVGGLVVGAASGPGGAQVAFQGPGTIPGAVLVRAGDTLFVNDVVIVGSFRNDGALIVGPGATDGGAVLAIDTVGVRTAVNFGTIAGVSSPGVAGGALNVSNATSLVNHGVISPGTALLGNPSAMTVSGNVTFATGSVVNIELGGTGLGQADVVGITGTATLGDTLRVRLVNGFVPSIGDAFFPVTWTASAGTFAAIQLPTLTGAEWQVSYSPVGLLLSVVAPPAPSVAVYQGDGQTAPAGTSVAIPPAVRLLDAANNPIAGAAVTFAVASGGGSISGPAVVATDASGIAQVGGWQLGPTPGTNTLTATVALSGVTGNPVTFTATGAPTVRTWTGAVSTDWSNPGNWSPAGVPGPTDDASVGPAANEPTLTGPSTARTLTITGNGAILRVGGQTLTVAGLNVTNFGLLIMTNPSDVVAVAGNASFDGGNENGGLSAGELRVGGSFYQGSDYDARAFAASGTHRTVLTGTTLQSVTFVDLTGGSHFQDLDISASAGINIQFDFNGVAIRGTFTSQPGVGPAPLLYGLGRSLSAPRFQISGLVVDDAPLILNEGGTASSQQFDNVTFQNFRALNGTASSTQLTVVAQGGSGPARSLTFNNLTFVPLVLGDTGFYLAATASSGSLAVTIAGSNVTNGPTFTRTTGSVTVTWQ